MRISSNCNSSKTPAVKVPLSTHKYARCVFCVLPCLLTHGGYITVPFARHHHNKLIVKTGTAQFYGVLHFTRHTSNTVPLFRSFHRRSTRQSPTYLTVKLGSLDSQLDLTQTEHKATRNATYLYRIRMENKRTKTGTNGKQPRTFA